MAPDEQFNPIHSALRALFKQTTMQDKVAMKKLCDDNIEFRIDSLKFNGAQATLRQQKIQIDLLKHLLNGRNDF